MFSSVTISYMRLEFSKASLKAGSLATICFKTTLDSMYAFILTGSFMASIIFSLDIIEENIAGSAGTLKTGG